MATAFIFHGSNGNPNRHWYPWLRENLEEKNFEVITPQFPVGDGQTLATG